IFARMRKLDYLEWTDRIAVAVPLGYTFGRLGNFINGELWGRITAGPLGMVFPHAERFPASEPWVREMALEIGLALDAAWINLPRHPTQLYQAFFEGVFLWLIMWFLVRPRRPFKGFAGGCFLIGYGTFRFAVEYLREPDAGIGFVVRLGDPEAPTYAFTTLLNLTTGQVLSLLMIVGGALVIAYRKTVAAREAAAAPVPVPPVRRRKGAGGRPRGRR
ncbi:MAG TPA: prolipoprotein diacylglyceryl transferase, partial [Magnetospirillaceae bacterium]|nr:prolipoprotein diacylglyceryl transferase [Magnetospirillaceae bacterium]